MMIKSKNSEKRLQHQLYLAKENPEPIFDISNCDLIKIPKGAFSLCKVLRKKKILLNNNSLKQLNDNNNSLSDLTVATYLNLSNNCFYCLPENIESIQFLEILNLNKNMISLLPESLGNLKYLKQLYVTNNRLTELPQSLLNESSVLEIIDVSDNASFKRIPIKLAKLQNLKIFKCTVEYLEYDQDVRRRSLPEIIQFACKVSGEPMSDQLVQQLSNELYLVDKEGSCSISYVDSSILDYEKFKQDRLDFLKSIETEYNHMFTQEGTLIKQSSIDKEFLLKKILEEESKINSEIGRVHQEREKRQNSLLQDMKSVENNVKRLLEDISVINKACLCQEKILDKVGDINIDLMHSCPYEVESRNLRRKEIINGMQQMLINQNRLAEQTVESQQISRRNLHDQMRRTKSEDEYIVNKVLNDNKQKQDRLIHQIDVEEKKQLEAFFELQLRKDQKTMRLGMEISWIQAELISLSQLEQKKRQERGDFELSVLLSRRQDLVLLMQELFRQRQDREKELMKRLSEMDQQREIDQKDYWLIQYQRLLDMKPMVFQKENCGLDHQIIEVLQLAEAEEYLPFFQSRSMKWIDVANFTEDDLIKICILNKDKRHRVLEAIQQVLRSKELSANDFSTNSLNDFTMLSNKLCKPTNLHATVTSSGLVVTSDISMARSESNLIKPEIKNVHNEVECCICLLETPSMLFLDCGHVCCCDQCGAALLSCPLCRKQISQIIRLNSSI